MEHRQDEEMKICFLGDATSIHVKKWARWFIDRGHELHLITDKPDEIKGVKLHLLTTKLGAGPFMKKAFQTKKIVRKLKLDIVHGHFVLGYGTWAAYSGFHPLILSAWGSDITREPSRSMVRKMIVKWTLKHGDAIIVGDDYTKNRLNKQGLQSEKIFVNQWGADFTLFNPSQRSEDLRRQLGEKKYMVLSVNAWNPDYQVDVLLRSIPYVVKEIEDVKFVILGGGTLENDMKALVDNLGIKKYVAFIGRVPLTEMPRYFASSDLLIDAADTGMEVGVGIGIANLEAMACGLPLLMGERIGLKRMGKTILDEIWYCNPYAFEPKDPKDLAIKTIQLLRNPEMRNEISKKQLDVAKKIGSWEDNMLKIEELYKKTIACRK